MFLEQVYKIAGKAITSGGTLVSRGTVDWDVSGRCSDPQYVEHHSRPSPRPTDLGYAKMIDVEPGSSAPFRVRMWVPCRRCEQCLRHRAWLWRSRAEVEIHKANRTWLGTLTLAPEAHHNFLTKARWIALKKCVEYDRLTDLQRFQRVTDVIGAEITKYIKRLRHQSNAPMRYLLVAEPHKSGLPHFHMLIHEVDPQKYLRHKLLKSQWHHGFSDFKLAEQGSSKAAAYVAKYLSKSLLARVRASQAYGRQVIDGLPPVVLQENMTPTNDSDGTDHASKIPCGL